VAVMRKWVGDSSTDNAIGTSVATSVSTRTTQVIEMINDAVEQLNMAWDPACPHRAGDPTSVRAFATIADISRAFTLNEHQHCAVKVIGTALLNRWKNIEASVYLEDNVSTALERDQLLLFLGGQGGTGKSRVIDAIQALCNSWGRSECMVKTALTRKAATIISGRTLASFLKQLQQRSYIETMAGLSILVIDEIAMMKKAQLVQLDKQLRIAKHVPGVRFGGVHIILVGDFLQLPPIGADPLYRDPLSRPKPRVNEIAGFQLWRLLQTVVILEASVRFKNDLEWGEGCRQARLGIWTPTFVNIVNSRLVDESTKISDPTTREELPPTFVTPDNSTRLAINNLFIATTAKELPPGEYPLRVVANFKGKLKGLTRSERQMVLSLPDSRGYGHCDGQKHGHNFVSTIFRISGVFAM
jgi:hypothetical protein